MPNIRFLQKAFEKAKIKCDVASPLDKITTWGVGGRAGICCLPEKTSDFAHIFSAVKERSLPFVVLGGGSNVLVSDRGFPGCVICTKNFTGITPLVDETPGHMLFYSCAGTSLASLLSFTGKKSLSGLEFAVGIPGTLGGALAGNAGAQGHCIGDLVETVEIFSPSFGIQILDRKDIFWGYRFSSLAELKGCCILGATLKFSKTTSTLFSESIRFFARKRRGQPSLSQKTSGSVFKNPDGYAAGQLLDSCGCKGLRVGGAFVSEKHANFIENHRGATAKDILDLIFLCRKRVLERKGVLLVPEVHFVGFEEKEIDFS